MAKREPQPLPLGAREGGPMPSAEGPAEKVYGGYDPAGLESQYNLRRDHPDRDVVYDEFAAKSEAIRRAGTGRYDLTYGPAKRQKLDYFPAGERCPVLVFFHGGYWRALDKSYFGVLAQAFVARGWNVALPNYTLAPQAGIDRIVAQARAAVEWVADTLLPDGMPLVVAGHSAGGHLAVMSALRDPEQEGPAAPRVDGLIPVSGVFDLEPIRHTSINELVRLDAAAARRNSPVSSVPRSQIPLLLIVGGSETEEFLGQTRRFAGAWSAAGNRTETLFPGGLNHFTVLRALADEGSELHLQAADFLERVRAAGTAGAGQ